MFTAENGFVGKRWSTAEKAAGWFQERMEFGPRALDSGRSPLANDAELAKLQKGEDAKHIVAGWGKSLRVFGKLRQQHLLYPELR